MKWPAFSLLLFIPLFALADEPEIVWEGIEDMYARNVISSYQKDGRVLIGVDQHPAPRQRPKTELFLFDFAGRRFRNLKDGRMQLQLPCVAPFEDGYAVLVPLRLRVYLLDGEGNFKSSMDLTRFDGYKPDFKKARYMSPIEGDLGLITFNDHAMVPNHAALGIVDFKNQSITYLLERKCGDDDKRLYWFYDGKHYHSANGATQEILQLEGGSFEKTSELRRARPPIEFVWPEAVAAIREQGGDQLKRLVKKPNYVGRLENVTYGRGFMGLMIRHYHDPYGNLLPERSMHGLVIHNGRVIEIERPNQQYLAEYAGKLLVFDTEEGEFRLETTPPKELAEIIQNE